MAVRKSHNRWHYGFQVLGVRHRGSIPEARNRAQAERAEAQIKLALFEQKFGDGISKNFAEFVAAVYVPWAEGKRGYQQSEKKHLSAVVDFFKKYLLVL
jgi:hypothetical protein